MPNSAAYKDNSTTTEVRYRSVNFPDLVIPKRRPVSSIEINVDSLSVIEDYRNGEWEDLLFNIIARWVHEKSFTGKCTVWTWGSPSVNFQHDSYSMFYAILGMPTALKEVLGKEIMTLGKHVRPFSVYLTPSTDDGWVAQCHIEDNKAWQAVDVVTWEEVRP